MVRSEGVFRIRHPVSGSAISEKSVLRFSAIRTSRAPCRSEKSSIAPRHRSSSSLSSVIERRAL